VSHSQADRNLLVGMLALQLNFVTREQLIAATVAWSRQKDTPLVSILADQGVLSAHECQTLSGLVDLHLARHGNDPRQSLASIDPGDAAEAIRGATDDADIHQSIAAFPRREDPHATFVGDVADPFHTTAPRDDNRTLGPGGDETPPIEPHSTVVLGAGGTLPRRAGPAGAAGNVPLSHDAAQRYEIIRPFQRGGLGQVSVARDAELNREVALKEILPRHADSEEARQRFVVEAEITGSLEHPGVVPVYGLGQYADGRPFYAMRFIRGDNLQLAIDEFHRGGSQTDRELRFRQLLGRFVDVCNAIEYAHNRCVLHRDLKPGNIMLGKYGETLVVDWGLAKTIGEKHTATDTVEMPVRPLAAGTTTETQMGRVVGTPAYMSPEQAAGRLDLLGPATDIYSLGATLYQLLTGRAPFTHADQEDLLGKVQLGRFPPPRQLKPNLPRPLEAICLHAMAREPQERYLSAHAMAEDVERYLADEPVRAYQEPWHLRIARWMRKHRALVYSAAAVLIVTAVALTLGVVLLGAANRREQAQRELAERHFELARNAVRDYYISVSEDTLLNQQGMQPLRDQLLRQALTYYQTFLESEPEEAELRDELAQAFFYVGSITQQVDSPTAAIPFYEKAIQAYQSLTAASPENLERWESYGRSLNAMGGALQRLERLPESLEYYQQAEVVRRRLVEADPQNVEFVRTLANSVMNQGNIWVLQRNFQRAREFWEQAQALREQRLVADDPSQILLIRDIGQGDFNLGLSQLELGNYEAAQQRLVAAIASFEKVVNQNPSDLDAQYRLAQAYRTLGDVASDERGLTAATAYYDRAFELLRTLSLRSPEVRGYKADLASMQLMVADLTYAEGELPAALAAIEKALAPLAQLADQYPDFHLYQRDLAVARRIAGSIRLELATTQEQLNQGLVELKQAVESLEALLRLKPTDEDFRDQLEIARQRLQTAQQEIPTQPPPMQPAAEQPPLPGVPAASPPQPQQPTPEADTPGSSTAASAAQTAAKTAPGTAPGTASATGASEARPLEESTGSAAGDGTERSP
jgi:serine/threonine-protein kinase